MTDPSAGSVRVRHLTLILGTSQLLSWATTFYLPAVVSDPAARDLHATHGAILGGFSWALLITGVCAPRVGKWIGRHGGRGALAASTIVFAAGLTILATAAGVPAWYAGWSVLGAGMAMGLYDAAFATAGVLLGTSVSPVITGVTLIAGFASTVGWPMGTALLGLAGWRGMLLAYAAGQLIVNLPLVIWAVPPGVFVPREAVAEQSRSAATTSRRVAIICLASFFAVRWFLTSAIAAHVLQVMGGLGLSTREALVAAMLIGPGQVAGRLLEWSVVPWLGPLVCARLGALLFPAGALLLLAGGPVAVAGFALLYGMSNGILTVNRGTLPMLVLGPGGYAGLLGWLAVPVLLAQAVAPTASVPLIAALPSLDLLLLAAAIAAVVTGLLLPLKLWRPSGRLAGRVKVS